MLTELYTLHLKIYGVLMSGELACSDEAKPKIKRLASFTPTIGDISNKKRYWGCLVCKSLKNDIRNSNCSFCGSKRAVERFCVVVNDMTYMCRVHLEKSFPILSMVTICNDGRENFDKIRLPLISENLKECVHAAIVGRICEEKAESTGEEKSQDIDSTSSRLEKQHTESENLEALDLFHKVLKAGESYAYDGTIGQYVHVDTLGSRSSDDAAYIHSDLLYLKLMRREKTEMCKIVQETLDRRNTDNYANAIDATADRLREWKGTAPCALCEVHFPVGQLLGSISFKSVAKWKADHNVTTLCDMKLSRSTAYDSTRVCLFCAQFFDASCTRAFEVEKEANEDYKQRTKQFVHRAKNKESPLVSMQIGVAIAELKHKKNSGGLRFKHLEVSGRVLSFLLP